MRKKALPIQLLLLVLAAGSEATVAGVSVAAGASSGSAAPCDGVLELGDSWHYWRDFRKQRALREPDLIRQMQAEIPAVPTADALAHLLRQHTGKFGGGSGCNRGWISVEELVGRTATAVRVDEAAPLLSESTLRGKHLSVLAVVRPGEYFPILATKQNGVALQDWSDARPMDRGEWVQVETAAGMRGWLYLGGSNLSAVKVAASIPAGEVRHPAEGSQAPTAMIVVLGFTVLLLTLLLKLRAGSARPIGASSYSSYSPSDTGSSASDQDEGKSDGPPASETSDAEVTEEESEPRRGWGFESECRNCGSVDHATDDCPHGFFALECHNCGSKNHSTGDCPHGIFAERCRNCGSNEHATDDCPHGLFAEKCRNCGSRDHGTDACPHGIFATECRHCGSKEHNSEGCPH